MFDHFQTTGQNNMDLQSKKIEQLMLSVVKVLYAAHLVYKNTFKLNININLKPQKK